MLGIPGLRDIDALEAVAWARHGTCRSMSRQRKIDRWHNQRRTWHQAWSCSLRIRRIILQDKR